MNEIKVDLLSLEKNISTAETDAKAQEQENADNNFQILDNEYKFATVNLPYPDVKPYDVGVDYDDISSIQYKKGQNRIWYERQDEINRYRQNSRLYQGHVNTDTGSYFIMDSPTLKSRTLDFDNHIYLINADDKSYANIIRGWRYPGENKSVNFSRNIDMHNRYVFDVDVILDREISALSDITDSYLRKALLRNKNNQGAKSIIQTIQKKQDTIRLQPKEKSFLVQGCAGSGKTMVLLHRLRYLLFNKDIQSSDYVLLVPSLTFKNFIKNISFDFKININRISPYIVYYQELLGESSVANEDISELVFDKEFLERVYSKDFMMESYKPLFDILEKQSNGLIDFCEVKLNELTKKEHQLIEHNVDSLRKSLISKSKIITQTVADYIVKIENPNDIQTAIDELRNKINDAKEISRKLTNPDFEITIAPDDKRITENSSVKELAALITAEEESVKSASVFTVASHNRKLKVLKTEYDETVSLIEQKLIEEEKAQLFEKASKAAFVFGDVSIETAEEIVKSLTELFNKLYNLINEEENKIKNLEQHSAQKFNEEISSLIKLVDFSSEITAQKKTYINDLTPSFGFFKSIITIGYDTLKTFWKYFSDKEKAEIKENFSFFTEKTDPQLKGYLYTLLRNACKKKIKSDYKINLNKIYKHYWYIELYCNYLTERQNWKHSQYIFMDETQDLSPSEIELIYKINSYNDEEQFIVPIINAFGDINQTISTHGLSSWDSVNFIKERFELKENFRNSNQIIDYCNRKLTFNMQKVGVDLDPVKEYESLPVKISRSSEIKIFIVKDEYAKKDLIHELEIHQISQYEIFTVKEVKGLEFNVIYVFDRGMTNNEKYIAYSRALSNLNVIKKLPQHFDPETKLYIQGEEDNLEE